jgi:polyisoprenoid-binding protein YceI
MRRKNLLVLIAVLTFGLFMSANTVHAQKGKLKVDPNKSKVEWLGKKVTGEHSGTIKLAEGSLVMANDNLKSGSFVVDMASIANTDIENADYRAKLVGHLKSDDFFGVDKHPKAKFVLKESKALGDGNYHVKGDITIKGITKPIDFKVNMHAHGDEVHVSGKIVIDRSKFNVRYGSGSFFDNLGDKTIYDDFELNLDLYLQ